MIPKKWVKFFIALFLLPFSFLLTGIFWGMFHEAFEQHILWEAPFLEFVAGGISFFFLLFLLPRNWLFLPYVYGHECTHALWVKLFGGNVAERFLVSHQGGHILANRVNTWIILAPYFFPIYSFLILSIDGVAHLITDVSTWNPLFLFLLGLSWAFHITFTIILIFQGQPDLHYGGTFFSMVLIYNINLLLLLGLLIAIMPHYSWQDFFESVIAKGNDSLTILNLLIKSLSHAIASLTNYCFSLSTSS